MSRLQGRKLGTITRPSETLTNAETAPLTPADPSSENSTTSSSAAASHDVSISKTSTTGTWKGVEKSAGAEPAPLPSAGCDKPPPSSDGEADPLPSLRLAIPPKPAPRAPPSATLQLVLSAKEAAEARAREKAEAEAALAEPEVKASDRASLRLPHLREPTKEPEPTDPEFSVRLGAFMERAGEESVLRLLQREFPEPDRSRRLLEAGARNRLSSSTPSPSPTSPLLPRSPAVSPVTPSPPRELRWTVGGGGGPAVVTPRRRSSVTLRRRRESSQVLKEPDLLAPVAAGGFITESVSGLARFQRAARTVRLIIKVCNALKSFVARTDTDGWSFVELYLHLQQGMRRDLAFNPHNFTKAQPLNGGPRLERLLAIPPEQRTSLLVQQILAVVRGHSGFSDFPAQVQIRMCRVMRYELYESRRILLRQGHQPTAFYLLLTGSLMVNIRDTHPSTGHVFIRTVSDLKEGDCFGELSLLEQSPRTATIICKSAVELVSIAREDFDRIVRMPLLHQRENNIALCRKHLLFEDFPCEVFYDNPEGFFFQYCPAGMVVVKNGQKCAYIVFVKSGKCRVVGSYNSTELTRKQLESTSRDMQRAFPLYTEVRKIASASRKRPGTHPEDWRGQERAELDLLTHVLGMRHSTAAAQAKRELGIGVQEAAKPFPPPLRKSRTLSNFYDKLQKERSQKTKDSEEPGTAVHDSFWASRLQGPVLRSARRVRMKARRPHTESGQNVKRLEFLQPTKEGFAQIAELGAGDVFGLETLLRRQSSCMSVVSQGAELLFVSKKLFLQHANIRVLRIVNDMSMTYPSAVDMHDQLKYQRDWGRYKTALVRHVLTCVGRRDGSPLSCPA